MATEMTAGSMTCPKCGTVYSAPKRALALKRKAQPSVKAAKPDDHEPDGDD